MCPSTWPAWCTVATSIPSTRMFAPRDDVEPVERIHVGAQGTGSHSAVPGDGPATACGEEEENSS